VVDDNSQDGTLDLVREAYADDAEVKTILRTSDRGLAPPSHRNRRGDRRFFAGDGHGFHTRPEEIPGMLHAVQIADLVNGSRFCPAAAWRHRALHGEFIYNLLVRLIIRTQIQDKSRRVLVARTRLIRRLPFDEIFFG